jgi:glycosyltransferase involved in cell wall biosynthesis
MVDVSVLVVTMNRHAFRAEALDSLRRQTHRDWEAVVVDNGARKARDVVSAFSDHRVRYVDARTNLGECGGRNLALAKASGRYICYLDDDDLLPDDSIARRLQFYEQHPRAGMVYGRYRTFRVHDGRRVEIDNEPREPQFDRRHYDRLLTRLAFAPSDTFYLLKKFNFVRGGTPLIRRETFDAVGPFDATLCQYGDYEMWLRIASRFAIRFLDHEVYLYRMHDGSGRFRASPEDKRHCTQVLRDRYGIRDHLQLDC